MKSQSNLIVKCVSLFSMQMLVSFIIDIDTYGSSWVLHNFLPTNLDHIKNSLDYNRYLEAIANSFVLRTRNEGKNDTFSLANRKMIKSKYISSGNIHTLGCFLTMQYSQTFTLCSKQNWFVTFLFGHLHKPMAELEIICFCITDYQYWVN